MLDRTEKLQKREREREQWLEARRACERRRHAMIFTEQRQMLLQRRREAKHRTELIAENQPLKIPSFVYVIVICQFQLRLIDQKQNPNVSIYYCILLVVHSFTLHTVKTESEAHSTLL